MVTLAVSGIVATVVFGSMLALQQTMLSQFQRVQAQQNARVAIEVIKRHLRLAGWGYARGRNTGLSAIPVGTCYGADQFACNDVDAHSDRLRIYFMEPDNSTGSRGFVAGVNDNPTTASPIPFPAGAAGHPLPNLTRAIISGACPGGGGAADWLELGTYNGTAYPFSVPGALSCDYDTGYNLGRGVFEDFFIDRTDATHPVLTLRKTDSANPVGVAYDVAYDIEHLQVRYGIDTTAAGDGIVDIWCHDPRQTSCATTLGADPGNHYRIVAVQVAVVARTADSRSSVTSPSLAVFDANIPGDGYKRWTYRSTIALRNVVP
jgi:hypothetical protein